MTDDNDGYTAFDAHQGAPGHDSTAPDDADGPTRRDVARQAGSRTRTCCGGPVGRTREEKGNRGLIGLLSRIFGNK